MRHVLHVPAFCSLHIYCFWGGSASPSWELFWSSSDYCWLFPCGSLGSHHRHHFLGGSHIKKILNKCEAHRELAVGGTPPLPK